MKKNFQLFVYSISVLIGFSLLTFLVYKAGLDNFWNIVSKISIFWVIIAVMVYAASWILRTLRLKKLVFHQGGESISLKSLFKLNISGSALNAILPAKLGDIAMIGCLRMHKMKIGAATAILLQMRLLDFLALLLLLVALFPLAFLSGVLSYVTMIILYSLIALGALFGILIFDKHKKISLRLMKLSCRFKRKTIIFIFRKINDAYNAFQNIILDRKLYLTTLLLSLVIWLLESITCYFISIAVGAKISVGIIALAVTLGNISKIIPVTSGGVGIYEGVFAGILTKFGLPFDIAIAIAISDHFVKKFFNLALGLPSTAEFGIKAKKLYRIIKEDRLEKEAVA